MSSAILRRLDGVDHDALLTPPEITFKTDENLRLANLWYAVDLYGALLTME